MQQDLVVNSELDVSRFVIFNTPIEKIREALTANSGDGAVSPTGLVRIRVPAGGATIWTTQDAEGERTEKELMGIVLGYRNRRVYWPSPLEESPGAAPPSCHSSNARVGVGQPGGPCCQCRFARFGSDSKGEGQACRLSRELFLLRETNTLPEAVVLPRTSIRSSDQYLMRLSTRAIPCYGIVTGISLERVQKSQNMAFSRTTFNAGCQLAPEQSDRMKELASVLQPVFDAAPAQVNLTDDRQTSGEII